MPMPRDIEPRRDPHPIALVNVVEKNASGGHTSGPPDQPAVQPDRHHLGRISPSAIEHVEASLR